MKTMRLFIFTSCLFSMTGIPVSTYAMPVGLVDFTAKANPNKFVDLVWKTASEINNDYFTVEKTLDGETFETVIIVKGISSGDELLNYAGIDPHPHIGTSYYRLKQTDFDGVSKYSDLVAVKFENENSNEMFVYPNPTNDKINILVNQPVDETVSINVINEAGKCVYSTSGVIENNEYRLSIDKMAVSYPGIYIVNITGEHFQLNKRVVVF